MIKVLIVGEAEKVREYAEKDLGLKPNEYQVVWRSLQLRGFFNPTVIRTPGELPPELETFLLSHPRLLMLEANDKRIPLLLASLRE